MWYTEEKIEEIYENFYCVVSEYNDCLNFIHKIKLKNTNAIEYLQQGYGRRLFLLKYCCEKIFEIFPPDKTKLLNNEELTQLDIFIQSFYVNICAIVDNLLWIINFEKKLNLKKNEVIITNKQIKQFFSNDFNSYLNDKQINSFFDWYEKHCKLFRHSFSHRIPLYVPPSYIVNYVLYKELEIKKIEAQKNKKYKIAKNIEKEQLSLCCNFPFFMHSFCEKPLKLISICK